ncbi:MAG TPA: hypothetical protein VK968_07830 [Roseimicrobium sp.]|nr:hypothetical protein [Roseimicrobium sp.]
MNLPSESVRFHKNGLEFLSSAALPPWTEVTVDLQAPDNSRIQGAAIVVACDGNARTGYVVSLMFTGLSPQAESRLGQLANL